MKNKKGFTLIEIIAVIGLISVIMLLVVPNVLKTYSSAKKNTFKSEILTLYENAYTSYISNSSEGDFTKRFCVGKDTTLKTINITEKDNLYYDITVDKEGKVISLKVSNESNGIVINNNNGIKKKDITNEIITESFEINCNNQ